MVTRPIKGTRPATAAGRRELLASAKERAEHIMIVDLERNDLARVAAHRLGAGSTSCSPSGAGATCGRPSRRCPRRCAAGVGLADLLRAVCPGGSVTGAPKLAALAADRRPRTGRPRRRAWARSAGSAPTTLDLGLTIRTAAADGDRLHLWAGGGITWDSDPAAEVAEAAAKAAPLRALLAAG